MTAPWDDPRVRRGMTRQLEMRRERIARGDRPLGWKVGFGSPASMEQLGTDAPLVGFLTEGAVVASGETVSLEGWARPMGEPEVAVYMGADLPAGADRGAARAAVAAVGPAIELADLHPFPSDVETILAGDIFQHGVILGTADESRAGAVLDGLVARIVVGGAEVATVTDTQAVTGDLLDIVRHVADVAAAFGEGLRAREVIITGSVVPPLELHPGDEVVFTLSPLPPVSVRFTG